MASAIGDLKKQVVVWETLVVSVEKEFMGLEWSVQVSE